MEYAIAVGKYYGCHSADISFRDLVDLGLPADQIVINQLEPSIVLT
jgi:hypothetical protein